MDISLTGPWGGRYVIPFEQCQSWQGIKTFIGHCFRSRNLGNVLTEDRFDLILPDGRIVTPHAWPTGVATGNTIQFLPWTPNQTVSEPQRSADTVGQLLVEAERRRNELVQDSERARNARDTEAERARNARDMEAERARHNRETEHDRARSNRDLETERARNNREAESERARAVREAENERARHDREIENERARNAVVERYQTVATAVEQAVETTTSPSSVHQDSNCLRILRILACRDPIC